MHSKIAGLIYDKEQEVKLNLVLLKEKLPITIEYLNWIMINLCSIFLELVKRKNIRFPKIDLETIYISQNYIDSLPYILSYVDIKLPEGKREEYAFKQMIKILKQLNYVQTFYEDQDKTLQTLQSQLLQKIGYSKDIGITFTKDFQQLLNIKNIQNIHNQNGITKVDSIGTPPFILNANEKEIVMKTYIQSQEYQLREVDLIEQFNSSYQPYLYTYIRYSNILILFLKKHKISFSQLLSDCFMIRKNQTKIYSDINKQKGYIQIFLSMVQSLKYLHSYQIAHRDIKPDNIMFDFQNAINNVDDLLQIDITCVIIDFDRSKSLGYLGEQIRTKYECNIIFRPPEVVKEQNYQYSYDIWQMGYLWLLSLKQDFIESPKIFTKNKQMCQLFDKKNSNYDQFIEYAKLLQNHIQIHQDLNQLIFNMIQYNPDKRPSLEIIENELKQIKQNLE